MTPDTDLAVNEAVRERSECRVCGESVPEADRDWKYLQAGGLLAGPFCSRECLFRWLL